MPNETDGNQFVGANNSKIENFGTCRTMLSGKNMVVEVGCDRTMADVSQALRPVAKADAEAQEVAAAVEELGRPWKRPSRAMDSRTSAQLLVELEAQVGVEVSEELVALLEEAMCEKPQDVAAAPQRSRAPQRARPLGCEARPAQPRPSASKTRASPELRKTPQPLKSRKRSWIR